MHFRTVPLRHESQTVPEELVQRFAYTRGPVNATFKVLKETRQYTLSEVDFEFYLPDELRWRSAEEWKKDAAEKRARGDEDGARKTDIEYTVRLDFYEAKGEGQRPVIIVSPILGGNMIVDWFAAYFASQGIHAAIVHRKRPKYDPTKELDQTEKYMRRSVIRTRQALDWLEAHPNVDPERIGSFGISYGGIVNTIVAAVEPRIKAHVIAMAGGPLADILVDSKDGGVRKYVDRAAQKEGYDTPDKLRALLREIVVSDTLDFAPYVNPDDVQFVISLFDQVVHGRYSRNLWRAMGEPSVIYTPLGHYSTVLAIPYLKVKGLRFYKRKFGTLKPI